MKSPLNKFNNGKNGKEAFDSGSPTFNKFHVLKKIRQSLVQNELDEHQDTPNNKILKNRFVEIASESLRKHNLERPSAKYQEAKRTSKNVRRISIN